MSVTARWRQIAERNIIDRSVSSGEDSLGEFSQAHPSGDARSHPVWPSLHFSHQLGASGLRISESRCAAATLAIEGRSPDADRV